MLLMKQKMFLGVPSVVWVLLETLGIFSFGGGGGVILSSFEKWSNYVHSCKSGTHGVKVTPFWAGTKPVIPGQCGKPLRNETERWHITYSRLPITRTFKGNRKKFELSGVRVTDQELEENSGSKEKNQFLITHLIVERLCDN